MVVGLVLLATLVVSALLATSAQHRKVQQAEQRQLAVQLADELLATWLDSQKGIPVLGSGSFPAHSELRWQTQVVASSDFLGVIVPVVRLDIQRISKKRSTILSIEVLAKGSSR